MFFNLVNFYYLKKSRVFSQYSLEVRQSAVAKVQDWMVALAVIFNREDGRGCVDGERIDAAIDEELNN